jgi:formylglycine-generating enzyme required for sulfatase activity
VYSLGATYFALLTGHAPFSDVADEAALAEAHAHRPVPAIRTGSAETPLRCEMIVRKAMAKLPAERYSSVAAMRGDLEAALRVDDKQAPLPPVNLARRRRPIFSRDMLKRGLSAAVLLGALGAAAYFSFLRPGKPVAKDKAELPPLQLPTIANVFGATFVQAPAGLYSMGDPYIADAKPHPVRISNPLFVGAQEVTQFEYRNIMGKNPSHFQNDNGPVDSVTWFEAREFCEKLSENVAEKEAGRSYRLPTEAEWEYCCRAGSRSSFAFGSTLNVTQANFRAGGLMSSTLGRTFPPNHWGIYDMHGNLWEWCADWYKSDYFLESPIDNPPGPENGSFRVARGGAWSSSLEECASARRRDTLKPDHRGPDVGFRIVLIVAEHQRNSTR